MWLGSPARAYQAAIHADGNLGGGLGFGDGDWILARVEGCPGKRRDVGWLPMMKASFIAIDNKVATAGFPKGGGYPQIAVHRDCVIRARTDSGALIHDCAVSNGQSGSPLLAPTREGLAVIGMVTGEIEPSDELIAYQPDHHNANYAIAVGDILEQPKVAAAVTADLARAGPNSFVTQARR